MDLLNNTYDLTQITALFINNKLVITTIFVSVFFIAKYLIVKLIKIKSKQDKRTNEFGEQCIYHINDYCRI